MNILVTGGAGFIGSHLCDRLIDAGHRVVCIDNLSLGYFENIAHLAKHVNFIFCHSDILDRDYLFELFRTESFDAVFHFAANSDIAQSYQFPSTDLNNTFLSTYAILDAMRAHGVRSLIFASSSAIYGELKGKLTESAGPLQPVSHYGAGKLASEAFISSFVANYGFQAWVARFPNVVGERATHGVIFDFINKLRANPNELEVLGNGMQLKPYLYVGDIIDALLTIWQSSSDSLNVYNIGVDSRTRVKTIAELVIREMGVQASILYTGGDRGWIGDVPEFKYDFSKIRALGWHAKNNSDEAVLKSIRYILGKS